MKPQYIKLVTQFDDDYAEFSLLKMNRHFNNKAFQNSLNAKATMSKLGTALYE